MNQPRRNRSAGRRPTTHRPARPADLWQTPPPLPDIEPIAIPDDVSTLLKTLGDPPTAGGEILAGYFSAVVERSAAIAAALALSADLLATADAGPAAPTHG